MSFRNGQETIVRYTVAMSLKRRTILVWFLAAVAVACTAGCLWLLRWGQTHGAAQPTEELLHRLSYLLIGVVLLLIGAFLVARRGDNLISWILLGASLSLSLAAFAEQYSHLAVVQPGDWPAGIAALWVAQWAWLLPNLSLVLLLLYYPTGRLLTPRWRWVLRLSLVSHLALALRLSFSATLHVGDAAVVVNQTTAPATTPRRHCKPSPPRRATRPTSTRCWPN